MTNAKDTTLTTPHKILLLGDTGSGKTTQLLTLPAPRFAYLFDPNALLSLKGFDVDYEEFLPDRLNLSVKSLRKDIGDKTTAHKNDLYVEWEKDFNEKLDKGFFNDFNTIALDSATTLLDLIMDRLLTVNGRAGQWPQQDDYGPQMLAFTSIIRTLTSLNKTVLVTGHIEIKQDQLTQRIFRSPMMTGRLKTKIPLLFSDIFGCDTEVDSKGVKRHRIQTTPDRMTATIRTAIKGLSPFEDVTLDFSRDLTTQGIGRLLK